MGQIVISGAAYGIDQAAHRGALVAGGSTIAVLPCAADRAHPAAHAQLLDAIAQRVLVVSKGPPGTTPTRAGSWPGTGSRPPWRRGPWSSRAPSAAGR